MAPAIPLPTFDRHNPNRHSHQTQSSRTGRSTRDSSSTIDSRPPLARNCASAFYDHPPTSISLTQIQSSKNVPTLKTFTVKVPKNAEQILITPISPAESTSKTWLESRSQVDLESQKQGKRWKMVRRARVWIVARKSMILKALALLLGVVVAVVLGVTISMAVTGHIGLNTKGRGF